MVLSTNRRGLAGVNEDASARLAAAGIRATCKFVPYSGPFGGGTNVCDIEDDGTGVGFEYGSEQILLPGGVERLRNDIVVRAKSITTGQTEQAKIQAMIASGEYQRLAVENRARLCLTEPWTCPSVTAPRITTPAPAPTAPAPSAQNTASQQTGNPNQSVPPRAQPGEITTRPPAPATRPPAPATGPPAPATGPTSSSIPGIADIGSNSFLTVAALAAVALIFLSGKK